MNFIIKIIMNSIIKIIINKMPKIKNLENQNDKKVSKIILL